MISGDYDESLPSVTVVTSSWQRARTVVDHAAASVAAQDYEGYLEHLVVIDGDDANTRASLEDEGYIAEFPSRKRYTFLGRNWSSISGDGGFGSTARLVGSWMAYGDLIAYLDDDNDYAPCHVREMAQLFISDPDLWFATNGPGSPPGVGRTDTSGIMHKNTILKQAGGFALDGYEGDGKMVERWLMSGLKWANKPNQTFFLTTGYHHGAWLG